MNEPTLQQRIDQPGRPVLYFAYGSNLDADQLLSRCSSARVETRGVLRNHRLAFGGFSRGWRGAVATALPARGARVEGLLYRVARAEIRILDWYEGHPFAYERQVKHVIDESGRRRTAFVYLQPRGSFEAGVPSMSYLHAIRSAYAACGFDLASLSAALQPPKAGAGVAARDSTRVFVYGTLLAGERNHRLLTSARFIGGAVTMPRFELRNLGSYPALVRGGGRTIAGEVYEVDAVTLKALDALERHPTFYRRFPMRLADGTIAETYLLRRSQVEGRPIIDSNNWRTRAKEA
ncbi:MAG: gamma-glutamylcyclotransferase [Kofleriaceae bacterium]